MIIVINSGSSTIKLSLFEGEMLKEHILLEEVKEHASALQRLLERFDTAKIEFVVHRVVHGGSEFVEPTRITLENIARLKALSPLAPLHNPSNVAAIEYFLHHRPDIPQIAVFDTAFHASIPRYAATYALPLHLVKEHKIKRYGFHGSSYAYLTRQAARLLNKERPNLILLHLGNGASICAVERGKSVDTSMGFTPMEGLVMGSRCGDVDVGIVLYLQREAGLNTEECNRLLNKESGLTGLCGTNDMREILSKDTQKAKLAFEVTAYRIVKYIGAYFAVLEHVDAIVFSGGIGEHTAALRRHVMQRFEKFSIFLDKAKNETDALEISRNDSSVKVFVIPTNEELEMLLSAKELLNEERSSHRI